MNQNYRDARLELNSAEMPQQHLPGSSTVVPGNTNKVLLHSLNELSIGTANLNREQTDQASMQDGTEKQDGAERSPLA